MRGLEAERDELLTTLTSLEGAKALLEAQLQRAQGGSCLKVTGAREQGSWWVCRGPGRSSWPGLGTRRTLWETLAGSRNMGELAGVLSVEWDLGDWTGTFTGSGTTWDTLGPISWAGENAGSGREYVGPGQSPHPRSRTCRSWRKLLARTENMPVWWGGAQLGWVQVAASGNRRGARGSLSFWDCPWSTKIAFANTWRTLAARGPVSTLECKTWSLKTLRDQLVLFPHCTGPRESQGLA